MALRQTLRSVLSARGGQSPCYAVLSQQQRQQHTQQQKMLDFLESQYPPFRNDYSQAACDARRVWTENRTGTSLPHMGQWMEDEDTNALKGNIEMPMGLIKLPVASVGPLVIHGEEAQGEFIAPMATTEGALTASLMRGVKALNAGSGVFTRTGKQLCSRGPCFVTKSASQTLKLGNWVWDKKQFLQDEIVSKVSSHAKLEQIIPVYDLEAVHIVFLFSTGDACGQNVVTVCAESIMHWIAENATKEVPEIQLQRLWIEANVTSDKKPGAFNILHGRGMSTEAKVILTADVLNRYLQTTAEEFLDLFKFATRITLRTTSGGGFHANPANTLTALYLATGQDPASVADSIAGTDLTAVKHDGEGGGMEISLRLQNLLVGTVGGGTALPTQTEGLEMLGCKGAGKVRKFAEIATAFCLALDVSTTSAIAAGIFASGHNKHGRNRPT